MSDERLYNETDHQSGFEVPANYFGTARNRLLHGANHGGFSAPAGYFDGARKNILNKIESRHKPARVISIRMVGYAAAAAILLVSGALFFFRPARVAAPDLARVSNDEIINYVLTSESLNDIPIYELYTNDLAPVTREDEEIVNQLDEEILLNEL